jgi:nucleoside-diphosphate-sugar epimerase
MKERVVVITGSSGFLGSALCVDLCRDSRIIGMDWRKPSPALQKQAPDARWKKIDISERDSVKEFFNEIAGKFKRVDFVLHMAAFYHFGQYWRPEYDRVNVQGLENILEGALGVGTRRFVFAGSIASLTAPPPGDALTERVTEGAEVAYARSKTIGETLLARYSSRMPTVALRIGGVFSDWCELPPLHSLMKLWSMRGIMGRMIPGLGETGFPYIHRQDFAGCVRRIIEKHSELSPSEIFFASPSGCTTHKELFPIIRKACGEHFSTTPVFIPTRLAKSMLFFKNRVKVLLKRKRYERRWMMNYVDRPLVVDTTYTQTKLKWAPTPELGILQRLPVLMTHFHRRRSRWELRNMRRNEGTYEYEAD